MVTRPTFTHRFPLLVSVLVGVSLGAVVLGGLFWSYRSYQRVFVSTQPASSTTVSPSPTPTPDPLAPFGILLLGFGGGGHDGGYLTDTMILAYLEPRHQRVSLISLPRDIWVQLPVTADGTKPFKLNAAYAIGRDDRRYPLKPPLYQGEGGGGALAKQVVSDVTGLPVHYFVSLSFAGFIKSIDALGGVTLRVPVTFDDPFYPIEEKKADTCGVSEADLAARIATLSGHKLEQSFECRYEQLHFDAGKQLMDGATALKYVRSRHSPQAGGDAARAARQRALLSGLREQLFSIQFIPKIIPFLSKLTYDMQTDLDLETLRTWLTQAEEYRTWTIQSIEVSEHNVLQPAQSSDRQYILIPTSGDGNWTAIHQYLRAQLASPSASPSAN